MQNDDTMTITILKDGTIKTVTDEISGPNHSNAESFLKVMAELAGGKRTRERRPDRKHHHHHHVHNGETHSH